MYNPERSNEELLTLAAQGDNLAKETLISQNTGLVHSVVKRFSGRGHETDDLFQIGCIGLIKAVHNFDMKYGVKFSTYAVPMIIGEIKRFIRDDGIIKVSRSLKEISIKALAIKEELTTKEGREPTLMEIASRLGISTAELSVALEAGIKPESLYAATDDGNRENRPLIERLENERDYESEIVDRLTLQQLLKELSERDRKILIMRYFKQKTQAQIAEMVGVSQVQVSRIEKKLLSKLRTQIDEKSE